MNPTPIVIAGAGIGGLCAGIALAQCGHRIIILERGPALSDQGAGVQLAPNATRRLRDFGVLDAVAVLASAPDAVHIRRARDGATLGTLPLDDVKARYGALYLNIHRGDLIHALAARVAQIPNIELRLSCALDSYAQNDDGVSATYADGTTINARALIGADGVRSSVRAQMIADAADQPKSTGRVAWRALIAADAAPAFARMARSTLWLGPRAHLVHYPLRGGAMINVVAVTDAARETQDDDLWSRPGDSAILNAHFSEWNTDARALIAATQDWRCWPLLERPALLRFNQGCLALLGDAAHPMQPFLAQGAAQAIEDASALAIALQGAETLAKQALRDYNTARIHRATQVQIAARRQALIYHLGGPAALARDMTMSLMGPRGMRAQNDWIWRG